MIIERVTGESNNGAADEFLLIEDSADGSYVAG